MPAQQRTERLEGEIVGRLSVFTFLTVRFRTVGPSDPESDASQVTTHSLASAGMACKPALWRAFGCLGCWVSGLRVVEATKLPHRIEPLKGEKLVGGLGFTHEPRSSLGRAPP